MKLEDLIKLNPKLILKKGVPAPFIEMAALPTNEKFIHEIGQREAVGSGAKFQNGDTLFARITPCLENGKGGYVSGLPNGVVGQGSTEFIVLRAHKKSDEQFAYYLSRFQKFRSFAEKGMEGTSGRQRVTWQTLADFELPDLSEMQRAALGDVLGSLDDKIDLNRRMNETLEEMARALFRDWFIDFGPTRRQMDGATDPAAIMGHAFPNNKAAALAPLFPTRLGENGLPEGWETLPLSEFCSVKSGKRPPNKEKKQTDDNLIPVWGGNGVSWFTNQPLFSERLIITGRVGTLGTVYRVFDDVWVSDNALCVFPNKNCFEFLFQSMKIFDYSALNNGSTQPLLTQGTLKKQLCINGGGDLRSSFQEIAYTFTNKVRLNEQENQNLMQMRDFLLPKLMSGEIQLKDAPMVQDTLDGQPIKSSQLGTRKNLSLGHRM